MHKIAIIPVGEAGKEHAAILARELDGTILSRKEVAARWHDFDAFVFLSAMGICVRTIAPLVDDKHSDPAVVCADTAGRHAIAVLSGHVGGANHLAREVASVLGAEAVVTTQSDNSGLWALDLLAREWGWTCLEQDDAALLNRAIFHFVGRRPTALLIDSRDAGTDYLRRTLPSHVAVVDSPADITPDRYGLAIIVSPRIHGDVAGVHTLHYVPRVLVAGLGLAHQASPAAEIIDRIEATVASHGYHPQAILRFATIDVKADEPVVEELARRGYSFHFYTAEQLRTVEVPTPSDVVEHHVGTPSVSEAAALIDSRQASLLVEKQKDPKKQYTLAIATTEPPKRQGHIEIVGAGPGDPDLVSVRGRRLLEKADLILYAGSLVPRELTHCAKPGCVVRSSASMALEEQCSLMKEHYDRGHLVVRLHTGDPCIFGAIQEQMAFFDREGMSYHITPGISSFLAAAAELRSQFTIPERCQTIILTRGEGRTPMPEREKLHLLARSQSTMCIFLSAAIVDDVQRELLTAYPPETPVAACYHLTWPDQAIYRGQLKDLAQIVHDHHLTLTTMIVVGESIDNRHGLSELYSSHFTHLYRKATE